MASISIENVRKNYGAVEVIKGVSFEVADGQFAVLVGPSGCGKSTLLRMIAGLECVTQGDIKLDGKRINDVSPDQRGIAMVFQSYALYPHMTLAENNGFRRFPRRKSATKSRKWPNYCSFRRCWTAGLRRCRAASDREWPSAGQSSSSRGLSFLMSP